MCFRAYVDQVRRDAGQTTLAVGTAGTLLRFGKVFVQFVHGALECVSINPTFQFRREPILELYRGALAVVPLNEYFHVVWLCRRWCARLRHSHVPGHDDIVIVAPRRRQ